MSRHDSRIARFFRRVAAAFARFFAGPSFKRAIPSFLAIGAGLVFGIFTMFLIWLLVKLNVFHVVNDPQLLRGIGKLLAGGFNNGMNSIGYMLYRAAPLILTGLAVGFAFKTGLFNIGAPGQLVFGALAAIVIGLKLSMPAPWHWMLCLVGGMAAGSLWGFIVGFLKSVFNVHEVVASIMMNYIAMYFAFWALDAFDLRLRFVDSISGAISLAPYTATLAQTAWLPRGLSEIFGGYTINIGILIALAAVAVMYVVLNRTTLGYQLKAAGFNRDASKYAGMNTKRDIMISMAISGLLAGLAGAIIIMVPDKKMFTDQATMSSEFMSIGFDGISIALLGLSEPIGVGLAGLFLAYIRIGGDYLDIANYMKELADVITSVIIYFSALSVALYQFIQKRKKKKAVDAAAANGGDER
ncbi:MAG: ABC transporter permease [Candidatus Izemoplasmatales bacterium]